MIKPNRQTKCQPVHPKNLQGSTEASSNDLKVMKLISKSRFQVYLAYSEKNDQEYAMKVFPYKDGQIRSSYIHETRMVDLDHPNIIKVYKTKDCQVVKKGDEYNQSSYLLMEYAPYGDFSEINREIGFFRDEKLARSYFHQLIQGLEYLHDNDMAHLDIKGDNLLMGSDYRLKFCDFDFCYISTDKKLTGKGTAGYRAPEVKEKKVKDPYAADIFAAGVMLFILNFGILPYVEEKEVEGYQLYDCLLNNQKRFWEAHTVIHRTPLKPTAEFKMLFESMVRSDPEKRASIEWIKESAWYKGPVYNQFELQKIMAEKISKIKK